MGRTSHGSTIPALSGGGCVMDLGVHLVDLALWTSDFPG
jgi:predicted dehydrogenase